MSTHFYLPKPCDSMPIHNLFYFRFQPVDLKTNVFNEPPFENFFETVSLVNEVETADAIILPNNFASLDDDARTYIRTYADMGERFRIPVYLLSFSDYSYRLVFDSRVRVFRMSSYKSLMRDTDIIVPTTARRFEEIPFVPRKKQELPMVSFCGYAGFKTARQWVTYGARNLWWEVRALCIPHYRARKVGIYWRRASMRALAGSGRIRTNFIVRRSFSGAVRTIELSPAEARAEFIDSIVNSDFVLAPKGDGNYSNRFLEALSLGRIPVLIDTDVPLPCENVIPYEKIMVRVPMQEVHKTAEYVSRFYDALSEPEWVERQALARTMFRDYLEQKQFFQNYFATHPTTVRP
ncbi:MAG: exostosin family protein [Patescibacteria group bacterium]